MRRLHEQLMDAVVVENLETVKRLVEQGADIHFLRDCILRWAAGNGQLEVVKFLVEQGADIHADDDLALRWAAEEGHLDIVKFLVEKGADIHARNEEPLERAAEEGYIEVVQFLVERGCPIDIAKEYGTDAVQDFCKAYELRKMLGAKLESPSLAKTSKTKLKI
ncbi:ankyrin repeat domain-containing protein [Achromobacter xylosoxidans]|uniref:ankyrin repeat domain-containing protein n=1 Tax=Alcaligenes xylosoxydans xylosoxydans TaxID=85698 RepID=UPI0009EBFE7A|nr:ankyrin repeat domain-containing protein [Achromobacter xylosoxidans]